MDFQFQHLAALHTITYKVQIMWHNLAETEEAILSVSTSICFVPVKANACCSLFVYSINRTPFTVPNMGYSPPREIKYFCVKNTFHGWRVSRLIITWKRSVFIVRDNFQLHMVMKASKSNVITSFYVKEGTGKQNAEITSELVLWHHNVKQSLVYSSWLQHKIKSSRLQLLRMQIILLKNKRWSLEYVYE